LDDQIVFRDFLLANPEEARTYLKLEQALARTYATDREAYTEAKTAYITSILTRARVEKRKGVSTQIADFNLTSLPIQVVPTVSCSGLAVVLGARLLIVWK